VDPLEIPAGTGEQRVGQVCRRLELLLRARTPPPLAVLAAEVDARGAAAVGALADASPWPVAGAR
jgi:hypothetical protein